MHLSSGQPFIAGVLRARRMQRRERPFNPLALMEASIVYLCFALAAVKAANSSSKSAAVRIAGACYGGM